MIVGYLTGLPGGFSRAGELPPLVVALRAGKAEALVELYDLHHDVVRRLARRMLGDPQAAEDLTQEVFLCLPEAIQRFDGRASVRSFLLAIVVNQARHHVRKAATRRRLALAVAEATEAPLDPETVASRRQLAALLWSALDELSIELRAAFVLCHLEERPSAEVAEILGVPDATVRSRLFHARRKLKDLLASRGVR